MDANIKPTEEQFRGFLEELRIRHPESGPFIDLKWESYDTIPVIPGAPKPDWDDPTWKTLRWIWQIGRLRIGHLRGDLIIGVSALPKDMQAAAKAQIVHIIDSDTGETHPSFTSEIELKS